MKIKNQIIYGTAVMAMLFTSCKKSEVETSNEKKEIEIVEQSVFLNELNQNSPQAEVFSKNSNEEFNLETTSGTVLLFPAASFEDKNGNAVTGEVSVEVREIHKKSDMILSGITTISDQGPLESAGEIEVVVKSGGEKVFMKEGKSYNLTVPTTSFNSDMKLWKLDNYKSTIKEWTEVEEEEVANTCDYFKETLGSLDPDKPEEVFSKVAWLRSYITNKVFELTNKQLDFNIYANYSVENNNVNLSFNTLNDNWQLSDFNQNTWDSSAVAGNATEWAKNGDFLPYISGGYISINPEFCSFTFMDGVVSYTVDMTTGEVSYNVEINFLGWCNIDRLISEYGASYNCVLTFLNTIPENATVNFAFPSLNGVLPCEFVDGKWTINRLPTGMEIEIIVFYKDDTSINIGTVKVVAAEEMQTSVEMESAKDVTELIEKLRLLD